jgi:hypothetical protein
VDSCITAVYIHCFASLPRTTDTHENNEDELEIDARALDLVIPGRFASYLS